MALYEQRWWKRLFKKRERKGTDPLADLQAIKEFLQDLKTELPVLQQQVNKLQDLEKERRIAHQGLLQVNIQTQAEQLDKLLERYEFFQNDTDINGLRLQNVARELLQQAKHAGMTDLLQRKKKDSRWQFHW